MSTRAQSTSRILGAVLLGLCLGPAATRAEDDAQGTSEQRRLEDLRARVLPLHRTMAPPKPGDWLLSHKEDGQTLEEYLACRPVTTRGLRKVLYVQPLGPFTETQRRIVALSAEFLGLYFGLEVKVSADLPLSVIPDSARRVHPSWGVKQILSTYVLDRVLRPRLPADAAAYIAFTAMDLYPAESWNFVFGQASLRHRVGVWSLYRNGDPDEDEAAFRLCLLRTLKTATHETGHMFSMEHCTRYECNMCGSNNLPESDRRPIALCPECLPKAVFASGVEPGPRFSKLMAFCRAQGLEAELDFYQRSLKALRSVK